MSSTFDNPAIIKNQYLIRIDNRSQTMCNHNTLALYHVGLNVTGAALVVRGVAQALSLPLSRGLDASISGIGGIGHLLLGVSLVLLLLRIRKAA